MNLELSRSFGIDPGAGWVRKHNAEAAEVLEAHKEDRPIRVPLLCPDSFNMYGFFIEEQGLGYERYFHDPDEMLRVQLEAARRRRELPIYDFPLAEAPESWKIAVDQWPVVVPGWVGCEIRYRVDNVPSHIPLDLPKEECLALRMPDPLSGGILETIKEQLRYLRERYEGNLRFLGRPVAPVYPHVDTAGLFATALDIRGPDIMADMYEDPGFVDGFLRTLAQWCAALLAAWEPLGGLVRPHFSMTDHGIDMLSPELYERFLVPVIEEMNARKGVAPGTSLHHCGRGVHLFPVMQRRFGLTQVEALTWPLVDIARVRRELGDEVWIIGVVADDIIMQGPPERIRQAVRDLMASGAKGRGRFALEIGDMLPGTPLEHRVAYYEAVREFGTYGRT